MVDRVDVHIGYRLSVGCDWVLSASWSQLKFSTVLPVKDN
jgi:hypothetical protein